MNDEIFLEGLRFYGYHGVNPEEQRQGQRFTVDVRLTADLRMAGVTDQLAATIDYSEVYRKVQAIVEGPPKQLIETVAEAIAATLLAEFAAAWAVTVTVRKPEAAIKGALLDAAGVTVRRMRSAVIPDHGAESSDERKHPVSAVTAGEADRRGCM